MFARTEYAASVPASCQDSDGRKHLAAQDLYARRRAGGRARPRHSALSACGGRSKRQVGSGGGGGDSRSGSWAT